MGPYNLWAAVWPVRKGMVGCWHGLDAPGGSLFNTHKEPVGVLFAHVRCMILTHCVSLTSGLTALASSMSYSVASSGRADRKQGRKHQPEQT